MNVSVIGCGSFGCALADHLFRNGCNVKIWGRDNKNTNNIIKSRLLPVSLGNKRLNKDILITTDMNAAISDTDLILIVVPSTAIRSIAKEINKLYKSQIILLATKGLEDKTYLTMDEIIRQEIYNVSNIAVISGPTHAEEVIRNMPTGCVIASKDIEVAIKLQSVFMSETFRVYTSDDIVGVELGGAIKNIIALAAGISDGIGYGDNAKAALITRGIVEISTLGKALGAKPETFNGLTGLGDLIVTCQSIHSRNRLCGYYIGKGFSLEDAIKKVGMVVEGVNTLNAVYELAKIKGVDTPIIDAIYNVLYEHLSINDVAKVLINREPKHEVIEGR